MYQRTVLIVEDEPLIRMMLADTLNDEGFGVIEAATVLEALACLGHQGVDAVITDIDMPGGLSGLDLASVLNRGRKGIPVIVTSGRHRADDCNLCPGTLFIPKPYPLHQMVDLLRKVLRTAVVERTWAA
ncbi:MAG: response regulator [Pseudorhizobium sp.]